MEKNLKIQIVSAGLCLFPQSTVTSIHCPMNVDM